MEGNLRFIINWASLKVESKFTFFALFFFVFEDNFPITSPQGLEKNSSYVSSLSVYIFVTGLVALCGRMCVPGTNEVEGTMS